MYHAILTVTTQLYNAVIATTKKVFSENFKSSDNQHFSRKDIIVVGQPMSAFMRTRDR